MCFNTVLNSNIHLSQLQTWVSNKSASRLGSGEHPLPGMSMAICSLCPPTAERKKESQGALVSRHGEQKSGSPSRGCSLRRYFFFFKLSCRSGIKLTGGWLTFYWPYPLITANRLGRRSQLCEEGDISLRIQIVRESLIVRGEKRRQRASCLS